MDFEKQILVLIWLQMLFEDKHKIIIDIFFYLFSGFFFFLSFRKTEWGLLSLTLKG